MWIRTPRGIRLFAFLFSAFWTSQMATTCLTTSLLTGAPLLSVFTMAALPMTGAAGLVASLLTAFIGLIHVLQLTRYGKQLPKRRSLDQHATIALKGAPDQVFASAEAATAGLFFATRLIYHQPESHHMVVEVVPFPFSFGDRLEVRISAFEGTTIAQIRSRPILPTAVVDYGSNSRNVRHMVDKLVEAHPFEVGDLNLAPLDR